MPVYDLYSKRKRRAQKDVLDVYQYDGLPDALRVQLVHIFDDALGSLEEYYDGYKKVQGTYKLIVDILCREHGWFSLPGANRESDAHYLQLKAFLLRHQDIDQLLDAVEVSCRAIDRLTRKPGYRGEQNYDQLADEALEEVNLRFRECGVGYALENAEIIRVDSQFLHAEVVKPAIQLLNAPGYDGVQEEYLAAHEHFRHGRSKEALIECLKAFESMMKVICGKRGWSVGGRGAAGDLINAIFSNELVPAFWQSHFTSLRATLESGVPTARNKLAGHGQGAEPTDVPTDLVAYMLHMTGAAIVLLSERDKALE
ncbi:hypothetical protein LGN07_39055 [Burkholderia cepacia]|uniref:STM4504/CBY_0614 family protein n=1 Tax=Burkholderia cepacia TaxID=292 RepID=UPI0009BCF340|nr:hypothetical protein [Burkholderia cepacia]MCA8124724.1 hypothetical protein [Burkholderia cepacia]NTX49639.1 hypothetical protein [Burkholderia cepacia]